MRAASVAFIKPIASVRRNRNSHNLRLIVILGWVQNPYAVPGLARASDTPPRRRMHGEESEGTAAAAPSVWFVACLNNSFLGSHQRLLHTDGERFLNK